MSQKVIDAARALEDRAAELQRAGQFKEAEQPLLEAINLWKLLQGPKGLNLLGSEMNLALSYKRRGDAPLAVPILQRVAAALAARSSEPHAGQLYRLALNNLAMAYRSTAQLAEAAASLRLCLSLLDRLAPTEDAREERACLFDNLADVLTQQGDLESAEAYAREALAAWRELRGEEDLDVAVSLSQVGAIRMRQGSLDSAREPLERALHLIEKLAGEDHPDVGQALNVLATLEALSGNFAAASACATRSLKIGRQKLSEDHPQVIEALDTLEVIEKMASRPSQ